jgi:hypothetical protein
MMDALIYGLTPSAKNALLESAPPESMFMYPKMLLFENIASRAVFDTAEPERQEQKKRYEDFSSQLFNFPDSFQLIQKSGQGVPRL